MAEKFLGILDEEDPIRQEVWYDDHGDKLILKETQNVDAILAENRRLRNEEHGRPFGNWKRIAQLPNIIINHLIKEGIWDDRKALRKFLNKTEFKNLRTKEGRL